MGANLTLFHKGLVLVFIPLLFELIFIGLVLNVPSDQRDTRLAWWGLASTLVLTVVLVVLFRRGISMRLATVVTNAERLARGEALAAPLPGRDEIAELDRAFHDMARKITASEDNLREQTQIWRAVLNSMGDGVMVADEAGKLLIFNPAAERILGLAATSASPAVTRFSGVAGW